MNKNKIITVIEYLSPILILSYLFIHDIVLVFIGIVFSIYLININFINIIFTKLYLKFNHNIQEIETDSIYKKSTNKDYDIKLVQIIDEIGFIPSINNNEIIHKE